MVEHLADLKAVCWASQQVAHWVAKSVENLGLQSAVNLASNLVVCLVGQTVVHSDR